MNNYRLRNVELEKTDYHNANCISFEFDAGDRPSVREFITVARNESPHDVAVKLRSLADSLENVV
jgi:hypothetical protein